MAEHDDYVWMIRVNTPRTWRQWIGQRLGALTSWVDGRERLAIEVASDPRLTDRQTAEVLMSGFPVMRHSLEALVREESIERLMQRTRPSLYMDVGHGQNR